MDAKVMFGNRVGDLRFAGFAFLALFAACSGSSSTDDGTSQPPGGTGGISSLTVGALPGDNQSAGFAVNTAGHVAGQSADGLTVRAYYWDGTIHNLTPAGAQGVAYAISSGSPEYAAGYQQQSGGIRQAVRWTLTAPFVATILDNADSFVTGLNDAGTAVGRYFTTGNAAHGAIWPVGQQRIDIPPPDGFTNAFATDIDNDGIIVGNAFGTDATSDRAWIRLADGTVSTLLLPAGASGSSAYTLSEVVNNQIFVAGNVIAPNGSRTAARWTVEFSPKATTVIDLSQFTVATCVSRGGDVAGIYDSGAGSAAVLWSGGKYTTLPAIGNAGARGCSGGAGSYYIVGDVFGSGFPLATRWTLSQ